MVLQQNRSGKRNAFHRYLIRETSFLASKYFKKQQQKLFSLFVSRLLLHSHDFLDGQERNLKDSINQVSVSEEKKSIVE